MRTGFYALVRTMKEDQAITSSSCVFDHGRVMTTQGGQYIMSTDGSVAAFMSDERRKIEQNNRELARGISEQIRQYKQSKRQDQEKQLKDQESA